MCSNFKVATDSDWSDRTDAQIDLSMILSAQNVLSALSCGTKLRNMISCILRCLILLLFVVKCQP